MKRTLALMTGLLSCTLAIHGQQTGAIFTTDSNCGAVDGNNYLLKSDVYLDGGPSKNGSPLPVGNYYVKVTDPSGATLLGSSLLTTPLMVQSPNSNTACIELTAVLFKASDNTPGFDTTSNPGCVYKVWASLDSSFPNSSSKTDNLRTCDGTTPPTGQQGSISGLKFYDTNANGVLDATESPIQGWQIDSDSAIARACTDATGTANFTPVDSGVNYNLTEVPPPPGFVPTPGAVWVPTTLTSGSTQVGGAAVGFGNVCIGGGTGARTLGFWSNKNGQNQETIADFTSLTGLNLVNANGSAREFGDTAATLAADKTALNSFLLGATATNMANMLSAQLAAMQLNVNHGVAGGSLVYAGAFPQACTNLSLGLAPANASGFISVTDLMGDANTVLGTYTQTIAASDVRTCEEYLKTALDKANNNLNFAEPGPASCPLPACPYAQ